jgi:tripartite-type tricarboxylate transporter receptor subunit TctC
MGFLNRSVQAWCRALALGALAMSLLTSSTSHSVAQDAAYPTRPVTLIVPFPPGGTLDILARLVGEHMSKSLGRQIVIENRAGAGGNTGSRQAARSAADGHTLLLTYVGTLAINPEMYSNMGYDPAKDLTPIGEIALGPSVLVVHPSFPAKTLREFIDYAKANPGKVDYASSGIGTAIHVSTEMLADAAGVSVRHIPYKGTGAAMADLAGGHVKVFMPPIPPVISNIRSGLLRPLAVTSVERSPLLPDVPTIAEVGFPGFNADTRFGLMVPTGTPPQIVARLNTALRAAVQDEALRKRLTDDGMIPRPGSPEDYAAAALVDQKVWGGLVKRLGLKAE